MEQELKAVFETAEKYWDYMHFGTPLQKAIIGNSLLFKIDNLINFLPNTYDKDYIRKIVNLSYF